MLQIYNTLSKKKEIFKPINEKNVLMYVCGMTVYDYCHIGHARNQITFDVVVRFLRYSGYQVKYIRNITDIDDKIIKRANENKEAFNVLTDRFIAVMDEDLNRLGLLKPDLEPRATEFMSEMIELIQNLIDKGFAYVGTSGDVYFDVSQFKEYGKLSKQSLEELKAGVRIETAADKKSPLDFVLWKSAKSEEPSWDSPWGKGRPGWHIECSAMSMKCLGPQIDIHGGGMDLIFPHHENEIAQTEAITGRDFANIWMHGGYLQINNEKMSKSLRNFLTIRDVLETVHPEVLRYFFISSHYRSPVNYTESAIEKSKQSLIRLYSALENLSVKETTLKEIESIAAFEQDFLDAMNDDFNTPKALSVLFDLAHAIQRAKNDQQLTLMAGLGNLLKKLGNVLGLLQYPPEDFLTQPVSGEEITKIEVLIEARNSARQREDFKESDTIRDELMQMGVVLEDQPDGQTIWRKIK